METAKDLEPTTHTGRKIEKIKKGGRSLTGNAWTASWRHIQTGCF